MTSEYEETYARMWQALRELEQDKTSPSDPNGRNTRPLVAKGNLPQGRLSEHAGLVNRMMLKGMTQVDIAQVTGKSQQSISQTQQRYGLPRTEEK
jgi:hypothetical protein